jgi:hypothetical protein
MEGLTVAICFYKWRLLKVELIETGSMSSTDHVIEIEALLFQYASRLQSMPCEVGKTNYRYQV